MATQTSNFDGIITGAFESVSTATTVTSTFTLDATQFNPIEYEYVDTALPETNYSKYYDTIYNLTAEKYQSGNFFNDIYVFTANTTTNFTNVYSVNNSFTTGQVGVCNIKVKVIGISSDGLRGYSAELTAGVRKATTLGSMVQIGATTTTAVSDFTTATATLTVVSPNIRINITGESPYDINWYVRAEKFFTPLFV